MNGNSLDRVREAWARLSGRQRIHLGLALATTLGLVWSLSVYATRVRYGVLYSGLERQDAAEVVAELETRQADHRLSAGGSVIEVPAGQVDRLRLELAGQNLPAGGGVGFEIFDKPAFGLSDFAQNVNYRRALEREVGRTIQSLDSVKSARVHLALPPESVFAGEHRQPSASVVVRLASDGSLRRQHVRAIAQLVASGIEGLDPRHVSVIDGEGRLLSEPGDADDQMLSATQVESKAAMERGIERTLVSILEPVVGPGRVRSRATVELNLTRVQRVQETYDPDIAVVRSEQKTRSRPTGGSGGAATGGTGGTGGQQQTSVTNFELNKTTATIAEPVGTLARQSVAVIVDHVPTPAAGGTAAGDAEPQPVPRTPGEMAKIREIVRAAIGIDENRGDVLIVENVPFDAVPHPGTGDTGGGIDWGLWLRVLRYLSLPLAVLLLALLVIRPGIAAMRALRPASGLDPSAPPTVAELQARLRAQLAEGKFPGLADSVTPLRRKLIEAATEDPKAAALVIKSWIDDEPAKRG